VKKVSEEKADKLERHGDHAVPDKGKHSANRQTVDIDFI
jgi:hypothetical protein